MNRRTFLAATVASAAAAALRASMPGRAAAQAAQHRPAGGSVANAVERVGIQLYTLRAELARDLEGTIRRVAALGYAEVELAGLYERSPADLRALLDGAGLVAPSGHFPLPSLGPAELPRTIEACVALGHRWLVCPFLPANERTLDHYRRHAEHFDRVGEACRAAGLRFAYHNHDFELRAEGGEVPLELLLRSTSPQLVDFELDLYWVTKGGGDPLDTIARHPGRFALWHVKDMDATEQRSFAEVGTGVIDFPAIFARSEQAGAKHYYVEQDVVRGEIWGVVERSRTYVASLRW
jgi:sugar phosphate isomerase/epimerase